MGKTLNELATELKECIIEQQSDAHNVGNIRKERYNNLKLTMDVQSNPKPHVVVSITMSEAEFDLKSGEKLNGSLGPDERYAIRWFSKPNTLPDLRDCWMAAEKNKNKDEDKQDNKNS